jgi:hypothetical protein
MATTDQQFRRSARHLLATGQVDERNERNSRPLVSTPQLDRSLSR